MTFANRTQDRRSLVGGLAGMAAATSPWHLPAMVAQETADLEYWDLVRGPDEYIETGERLVAQFNDANDEVDVDYRSIPLMGFFERFTTAIDAGTGPDVSTGSAFQAVHFYEQGAISPVDDLITRFENDGTIDDFLPGAVELMRYDDHYVALPWSIDLRILYYRKDILSDAGVAPPTTWEEFTEAAAAVTTDDRYGFVTSGAEYLASGNLYAFILNNGGALFTSEGGIDLMQERNIEALQFYADLVEAGSMHPGSANFSSAEALDAFAEGSAAMIMDGPEIWNQVPEIADQIEVLSPLVAPHGDTGTISWVNSIMMYEQAEDKDAVMEFLTWWSANQGPLWTQGSCNQLPVRQSIASDPYFTADEKLSVRNSNADRNKLINDIVFIR